MSGGGRASLLSSPKYVGQLEKSNSNYRMPAEGSFVLQLVSSLGKNNIVDYTPNLMDALQGE
jgi:hypothetical protein